MYAADPGDVAILVERISVELVRDEDRHQNETMHGQTINLKWHARQRVRGISQQSTEPLVDPFELPLSEVAKSVDQNERSYRMLVRHLEAPT